MIDLSTHYNGVLSSIVISVKFSCISSCHMNLLFLHTVEKINVAK